MAVMAEQSHLDAIALDANPHVGLPTEAHSSGETNGAITTSLDSHAPTTNGDHAPQKQTQSLTDALVLADDAMGQAPSADALQANAGIHDANMTLTDSAISVDPASSLSRTVPPAVEQPTSDIRDETASLPAAGSNLVKEEGNGDAIMEDVPLTEATAPAAQNGDVEMADTVQGAKAVESTAKPAEEGLAMRPVAETAAPTDATVVQSVEPAAAAQERAMDQQSDSVAAGQVRRREDDDDAEPITKRTKISEEPSPHTTAPESKASEVLSTTVTETPAPIPLDLNGSTAPAAAPLPTTIEAKHYDSGPVTPAQKKFLLDAVRKTRKTKAAFAFIEPVDPIKLNIPTYSQVITQPMDLSTMEEKLKHDKYSSANAVAADVDLIVQNTLTFNGPNHAVTTAGYNMLAYFSKVLQSLPQPGQAPEVKKKHQPPPPPPKPSARRESRVVAKSPTTKPEPSQQYALNPDGMPQIRRDSSAMNDRPKREIHPPKNREMPYSVRPKKKKTVAEFKFCESVLKELTSKKHAALAFPFMHPVDPVALNIPTYFNVVKKPTDLGTIGKHLQNGEYNSAKDFYSEVKLMFANCYKFNPPEDAVNTMGKQLETLFERLWAEKDEWMATHVRSERETTEEADDDEEEEEEVVGETADETMKRMLEIQQQIAALSQEAMKLSTSSVAPPRTKAASPKTGGKKSKAAKGAGAAKPKRTSSTIVPPAPAKQSKVKKSKFKKLTLDQKRYVSEGIADLEPDQMQKAVQIIRNGVPKLRNVQDDELELDIDDIPDPVVFDLYQFVRKLRPKEDQLDEDDDYEEDPYMAKSSKAGNRKKNKPMSAREQESKIAQVQKQLQRFNNGSGSEAQSPEALQEESSDDDQSESSEEE